jgi:hypothetical protein
MSNNQFFSVYNPATSTTTVPGENPWDVPIPNDAIPDLQLVPGIAYWTLSERIFTNPSRPEGREVQEFVRVVGDLFRQVSEAADIAADAINSVSFNILHV